MKKYKFIPYIFITFAFLFLMYIGIFFITGKVTINVKDQNSNKYITNVNIKIQIQPDLIGTAGPGNSNPI
jgi:hypothetical protein